MLHSVCLFTIFHIPYIKAFLIELTPAFIVGNKFLISTDTFNFDLRWDDSL